MKLKFYRKLQHYLFGKKEKWYSREEFHNAYLDAAQKEISKDPVSRLLDLNQLPLQDISNVLWYEITMYVDCEHQKVIED